VNEQQYFLLPWAALGCCTVRHARAIWRSAKYLVEELGGDPNMTGGEGQGPVEGVTPFMASAQSGDISTVKYLLDHGGDIMKPDAKGRTVLHHAVCSALQ
jgi:hypothetical protein